MNNKVVIFGDSHARYFKYDRTLSQLYHWGNYYKNAECHVYPGASVKGFGRRTSTLNLKEQLVEKLPQDGVAVLCFGQVDVELGIYYKQFVKGKDETPEIFINECIQSYQSLIDIVKPMCRSVIIKGINLPVLIEQQKAIRYTHRIVTENLSDRNSVDKARSLLKKGLPTIHERISLVHEFNSSLMHFSKINDAHYFDINSRISYPNGMVKEDFIPSRFDHHLSDTLQTRIIHLECLSDALKEVGS